DQVGTVSFGQAGSPRRLTNVNAGINDTDATNKLQVFNMIHGMGAVFIGVGSTAVDTGVALGDNTTASQPGRSALGTGAGASATNATALGTNSIASGAGSATLGTGAQASATNSVALGAGSVASQPNTVSLGAPGAERRITNVAPGVAPTDAANVAQ